MAKSHNVSHIFQNNRHYTKHQLLKDTVTPNVVPSTTASSNENTLNYKQLNKCAEIECNVP